MADLAPWTRPTAESGGGSTIPSRTITASGDVTADDMGGRIRNEGAGTIDLTVPADLADVDSVFEINNRSATDYLNVLRGAGNHFDPDDDFSLAPGVSASMLLDAENVWLPAGDLSAVVLPFDPEALPNIVNGWWTTDMALSDGAAVAAYLSAVGGTDATQSNGARKPVYKTAGPAGHGSINFTANERRLLTDVSLAGSYTIYVIAKFSSLPSSGAADKRLLSCDAVDNAAKAFGFGLWTNTSLIFQHGGDAFEPEMGDLDTGWHVYALRKTAGGAAAFRIDLDAWVPMASTAAALTGGHVTIGAGTFEDTTSLASAALHEQAGAFVCSASHSDGVSDAQIAKMMAYYEIV